MEDWLFITLIGTGRMFAALSIDCISFIKMNN
jgi:hypothetical protein